MKKPLLRAVLFLGTPLTYISAFWMWFIKRSRVAGKREDSAFMRAGVLPVIDHYYEPLINPRKHLKKSLGDERNLPGIELNVKEQLNLLNAFDYAAELKAFPQNRSGKLEYYYNNRNYGSGDSEMLYNMIRYFKPSKIVEIGSGMSTLMAIAAVQENKKHDSAYNCEHVCIEPYEQPWLTQLDVKLVREKVEDLNTDIFRSLTSNDILFIDSSHIIRPQGDVLVEYLEILPQLGEGVLVHIHDIFTPRDYPEKWIMERHRLWNEQYLLEAFLSCNDQFEIIAASNYLSHHYPDLFAAKCPVFGLDQKRELGSFWIRRRK